MKPTHIEHIGIAVESIETTRKFYEQVLGLECYAMEEVPDQKVKTAFFRLGDTKIELLESTDPEGPIAKFIARKGPGLHHIALAVENAGEALAEAASSGTELIDKVARKGAENLNIGFLHPRSAGGVLIEFCSK